MKAIRFEQQITPRKQDQLQAYFREISRFEPLTATEEKQLAEKIANGDQGALNQLIKSNLKFVISCAKQYMHLGAPLSDLISEGNIGLIKAAKKFDPSQGVRFTSYGVFWIRHHILNFLTEHLHTIRQSGHQFKSTPDILRVKDKLEQRLERPATDQEIVDNSDFTLEMLKINREFQKGTLSLDAPLAGDEFTLLDLQPSSDHEIEEKELRDYQHNQIETMLDWLNGKNREVIRDLYGLGKMWPMSAEEIAKKHARTSSRIWQINEESIHKIQSLLKTKQASVSRQPARIKI